MSFRTTALSALLLASAAVAPGHAQSAGELTVTVGGEEQVVPLWVSQSDWSGGESWPSINIYARAFDENGEDPLVVTLGFEAPRWTPGTSEMGLTRYEAGEVAVRLFSGEDAEDGGLSVTLDSHEVDGTLLTLTGSFEGVMGTSDNYGRDIDLSEPVPVAGSFAVSLEELE